MKHIEIIHKMQKIFQKSTSYAASPSEGIANERIFGGNEKP